MGTPLGPVPEYNYPKDLIKAAKDFPDVDLVYHSGMKAPLPSMKRLRRPVKYLGPRNFAA
jgi:hypothetical protein